MKNAAKKGKWPERRYRMPMPKASAEGTERLAARCRENAGLELTRDQAKELLERAVRMVYLAYRSSLNGEDGGRTS